MRITNTLHNANTMGVSMTGLPENVEELLTELVERSRHEMNIVLALADAIRRTDEQLLREVRNVTMHHEIRREEIRDELQALASRLCVLPARTITNGTRARLNQQAAIPGTAVAQSPANEAEEEWPTPADRMDAELAETFGSDMPRH